MYFHQAMKAPDKDKFIEKEFGAMIQSEIVEIIPLSEVTEGAKLFPAVWAMRRKRRVLTREIYKWKARMNLDGSKQREGSTTIRHLLQ
jgi:hypothetical protein